MMTCSAFGQSAPQKEVVRGLYFVATFIITSWWCDDLQEHNNLTFFSHPASRICMEKKYRVDDGLGGGSEYGTFCAFVTTL